MENYDIYYTNKNLCYWLVLDNDYIRIIKEDIINRKTPIYHIYSKHSEIKIAEIKWYGAWRKYCLFPSSNTIWDKKCLNEIIKFLDNL